MIAGVVVTLLDDAERLQSTLDEVRLRKELELGEFQGTDRRIPLTVDSGNRSSMEDVTDWLRARPGVAFVDVVFVHLEEADAPAESSLEGRSDLPAHSTQGRPK